MQSNNADNSTNNVEILEKGNWLEKNRERLNALIKEKAFQDNYVVFDWDFTCIFYDTQDNIFAYQVENLLFKLNPQEFSKMIRAGIPQDIPFKRSPSLEGREITAGEISEDLDARYSFLYQNYEGFEGTMTLEEISKSEEYIDFKAKIFALASNSYSIGGRDLCQSVSSGFTMAEFEKVAEQSIESGEKDEIKTYRIESSAKLRGKAGRVQAGYRKGMRAQPEIQDLFAKLKANGIKPYICTASQTDPVRVFASYPSFNYNLEPSSVFGRRRIIKDGRITDDYDNSVPVTSKEGKAKTIESLIAPQHKNKAPILIAGDSDGDFNMMDQYKDEAVILILERAGAPKAKLSAFIEEAKLQRNDKRPNILLQSRNETKGCFSAV